MMKYWIKCTTILYIFWLTLSGHFEAKYLIIGLLAAAVISYVCVPLLFIKDRNEEPYCVLDMNLLKFATYWIWLFKEICKSSFGVAKIVLKKKMPIQPQLVKFRCEYCNPVAITMLINSIILTPGTVTIDVQEKSTVFVVHALTDDVAKGLLDGTMQNKIGSIFGEHVDVEPLGKEGRL